MTNFWSCHLVINRNPPPMILGMFVTSWMLVLFVGKVFLLHILNAFHPQTLTFFLAVMLIMRETLNIYTANVSTFTVCLILILLEIFELKKMKLKCHVMIPKRSDWLLIRYSI